MKHISTIIKGLLLTALAIGVFTLNVHPNLNRVNSGELSLPDVAVVNSYETRITDCFVDRAFADPPAAPAAPTSEGLTGVKIPDNALQSIAVKSQIIFKIFNPFTFFLTKFIDLFLKSDFVYAGKMGEMLQKIWVVSRNIVNIVFVLVLLYLAIMYIFGEEGKTDLKKILPKFALMLIAVNFSWLGAKLIVDAANVATNVAFAIPNGVQGVITTVKTDTPANKCVVSPDGTKTNAYCMPSAVHYPAGATTLLNMTAEQCKTGNVKSGDITLPAVEQGMKDAYQQKTDPNTGKVTETVDKTKPFYGKAVFCWSDLNIGKFNSSNAAFQMTYSMARVQNLPLSQSDSASKLAIGTIFALFAMIVYLISFAALTIALIFRVAFLWVLVAFSPFIVLLYFFEHSEAGGLKSLGGGAEKYLSIKTFTEWAFAPTKVALIWSIGFIMITTGQTASQGIFANFDANASVPARMYDVSSVFMGMNSLSEMIWLLMSIVIIWVGTFAVLGKLEGANLVTNKINTAGTELFKTVASTPLIAPIIPALDEKGGIDWSKDKRKSLGSVNLSQMYKEKILGIKDDSSKISGSQYADAVKKFKGEKVGTLKSDISDAKRAEEFSRTSGFTMDQVKGDSLSEEKIKEFLKGHDDIKDEALASKLAKSIKNGAKGASNLPAGTAVPPTTSTATEMQEAVRKGVEAGLKNDKKLATAEDMKAAFAKSHTAKPDINDDERIKDVIEILGKDGKTKPIAGAPEPAKTPKAKKKDGPAAPAAPAPAPPGGNP